MVATLVAPRHSIPERMLICPSCNGSGCYPAYGQVRTVEIEQREIELEAKVEARELSDNDLGLLLTRLRRDLLNADDDAMPNWIRSWWQIRLNAADKEWQWRQRAAHKGGPVLRKGNFRERLDDLRTRHNLVDVIGRKVALKQAGREYKGKCPFHEDSSPSFYVNPERGLWHCFGCKAAGDLFTWVEMTETPNGEFAEAVRWLEGNGVGT